MTSEVRPAVTVIGLGEMGSALAGAFLDGGHPTTVWNRTAERADALVSRGAERAGTVRDAVLASRLVVVSVQGNDVAREVLDAAGEALSGRVVVNLTDGPSAAAREVAEFAAARDAKYLHGQIMTIAPGIGSPDAVVFYGGAQAAYDHYRPVLELLGGRSVFVSSNPGVPGIYGMAVHGTMWGLLNGFLHAAALLSSEGITTEQFLEHADPSLAALAAFLPMLGGEVDRAEHATEFGGLKHHLPSIDDLVAESRARGLDVELPAHSQALVNRALADGHGDDSYSRLVDYFKRG
ncbi:NAD(P)-binding domain-containing protein [Saccharopolyspora indica]|uniref:NAD(P)-dependent oxidoreductase n=1 Tax=Saccharopolyspora indica TaxID=1229659 RepID=UPI0022EB60E8|nr:NAD(P)-binding domain-containing protein [Saccharopolyspora indica]MDA3645366.1 NAD(P)-binding domain-containing protein [Saccharopolyspora indica]